MSDAKPDVNRLVADLHTVGSHVQERRRKYGFELFQRVTEGLDFSGLPEAAQDEWVVQKSSLGLDLTPEETAFAIKVQLIPLE